MGAFDLQDIPQLVYLGAIFVAVLGYAIAAHQRNLGHFCAIARCGYLLSLAQSQALAFGMIFAAPQAAWRKCATLAGISFCPARWMGIII